MNAGKRLNISLGRLKSIRPGNSLASSLGEPEISSTYFLASAPLLLPNYLGSAICQD